MAHIDCGQIVFHPCKNITKLGDREKWTADGWNATFALLLGEVHANSQFLEGVTTEARTYESSIWNECFVKIAESRLYVINPV